MPAPKGNQYAVGNSGQPPSKYTDEFNEQEAIAFIHWFSNPENIYFKRFALERGYPPDELAHFAKKSECSNERICLLKSGKNARS